MPNRDQPALGYDVAQVCQHGHVVNAAARSYPSESSPFCPRCGSATITACQKAGCDASIRGAYRSEFDVRFPEHPAPFCHACGAPYPWRQAQLDAADELAREAQLSADDEALLAISLKEAAIAGPRQEVAGARIRRLLKNAPAAIRSGIYRYLVDVGAKAISDTLSGG